MQCKDLIIPADAAPLVYTMGNFSFERFADHLNKNIYMKDDFLVQKINPKEFNYKLNQFQSDARKENFYYGHIDLGEPAYEVENAHFGLFHYNPATTDNHIVEEKGVRALHLIGYAECSILGNKTAEMDGSYITPSFRGNKMLYQARVDWAANMKSIAIISTYPHQDNLPSRKAAEKFGFELIPNVVFEGKWGPSFNIKGPAVHYQFNLNKYRKGLHP